MRWKLDGGGVSGGLSSGWLNVAMDWGAMVLVLDFSVKVTFGLFSESKVFDFCPGCCADKSGGTVRKASSSFFGLAVISAPHVGQNRYSRFSTSGSCELHLGQVIGMIFQVMVFEKG